MTGAHLHLLVNHVPILGTLFALGLLVASFVWAPEVLRRTAFVVVIGAALAGGVAFLSGDPAEHAIQGLPGVQRELIHNHESIADIALIVTGIVAVLCLWALVRWRREPLPRSIGVAALVAVAIASGVMAYTGLLGGRIRHTEVRPGATAADASVIEPPRVRPGQPPG